MPLINTASKVYKGSALASKVYRGTVQVWPPAAAFGPNQSVYTTQTATSTTPGSNSAYGNHFTLAVAGRITALRFKRNPAATLTTHAMRLYTSDGLTLLASASTIGETGSGWKDATLGTPVMVTAGQTVLVVLDGPIDAYDRINNFVGGLTNGDIFMAEQTTFKSSMGGNTIGGTSANTRFMDLIFQKSL